MVSGMMMNDTVLAIASRHFADSDEGGRTCRACGRPWPCDVRQIVASLTSDPQKATRIVGLTTNGAAHRRTPVTTTRPRRRVPAAPSIAS